jgi:hypothetical protein
MEKSKKPPFVATTFFSGQPVPRSGTYRTLHHHRLASEIVLLSQHVLPVCAECGIPVRYVFVNCVPVESAQARFRLLMHKQQSLVTHLSANHP